MGSSYGKMPDSEQDHQTLDIRSCSKKFWCTAAQKSGEKIEGNIFSIKKEFIAEFTGTAILIAIGIGGNCSGIFMGSFSGLWQIASLWGFAVITAVCCTASVSGAHMNPAVSLALTLQKQLSWPDFFGYVTAQLLGAIFGAAANLFLFWEFIKKFEEDNGITRGTPESVRSAMAFGEYFPNPAIFGTHYELLSPTKALLVELWSTMILLFVVKAVGDQKNKAVVIKDFSPLWCGFAVTILGAVFAPLTQCGMNPARDFGPRLVTYFAGWGSVALPGPRNGFWVYILGPLIGGPLGAFLYDVLIRNENDEKVVVISPRDNRRIPSFTLDKKSQFDENFVAEICSQRRLSATFKDAGVSVNTAVQI